LTQIDRDQQARVLDAHAVRRLANLRALRSLRHCSRFLRSGSLVPPLRKERARTGTGHPRNPMIDFQQFENIKQKHGSYASWAVWADASEKPKSNMGDVSHFKHESVLSLLKNNVVMVGLNISRPVSEPFINFHDPNPRANDFKIRYAFKNSAYYGAYMTDIIKFLEEVDSTKVMKHLKEHPEIIEKNLETFREEMQDIKATAPVLLAFGKDTHKLLSENLNKNEYRKLIKLTHYSHQIGKEAYKLAVSEEIGS
jgi:hypothetical protein